MAQTVVLASGVTAASSAQQTLAAGVEAKVCGYTTGDGGQWGPGAYLEVVYDTPGDDQPIARLTQSEPAVRIVGPLTYLVKRPIQPSGRDLAALVET